MAYSTIPKGILYMNTKLYTGNGTTDTPQTGVGFQPDWTWIKGRSVAFDNNVFDAVRGPTKRLITNSTNAETTANEMIKSFNSDGFTLGNDDGVNKNSDTFVAWNWKANGSGSANTDGSINSTVSVSTAGGFSIVKYTGNGSDQTVGHGLGVAPSMIIVKCLTTAHDWVVYHQSMGNGKAIALNLPNVEYSATAWQNTSPTNQVFYIKGGANSVSQSGDFVAYCFAEKKGFSKFDSYGGSGDANGPMVYTGFKPAWIMLKESSGTSDWSMYDNKREPFNVADSTLEANTSDAEAVTSGRSIDILSNGFKLRGDSSYTNESGATYIYMAFAENPFVATSGSTAVPVTAR